MDDKTAVSTKANRLYWNSDESVAEISNQLGVSRRALYEFIEPLPAGAECASCGAEMYYNNRSAKSAGVTRCLVCGTERELDQDVSSDDVGTIPPYAPGWPAASARKIDGMRERAVAIAGFAIAGVVVGAILTLLIRRKR